MNWTKKLASLIPFFTDACVANPEGCLNGGRCVDDEEGYGFSCECVNGFSGNYCEVLADFCQNHICANGAYCVNNYIINRAECVCQDDTEKCKF